MAAAADAPERVASSEADFVLTRADDIQPTPPGRWARLTMTVLARCGLVLAAAEGGTSPDQAAGGRWSISATIKALETFLRNNFANAIKS